MKLNDYIASFTQEQLSFIIENGKRTSVLDNFDFQDATLFTFNFVKETIPNLIKIANFEQLINECFKDRGFAFGFENDNQKCLQFILWLKDELKSINDLETNYLTSDPDIDMISAGVNEMNQFGNLNVLDQLSGGDILKWEEIGKLQYAKVFDKLYKSTIENNIQKKLNKILANKNKRK